MSLTGMPVSRSLVISESQSRSASLYRRRPSPPLATGPTRPMRSYQRSVCWDKPHLAAASPMLQVVTLPSVRLRVHSNANSAARSASLVLYGLGRHDGRLRVEVAAAPGDGGKRRVELVDQWDAGRHVQLGDLRVADPVQVLDQGAQRVAVRDHENGAARRQVGHDRVVP